MLFVGPLTTLAGSAGWMPRKTGRNPPVMRTVIDVPYGTIGIRPRLPIRSPMHVASPGYVGSTMVMLNAGPRNTIASAWRAWSEVDSTLQLSDPNVGSYSNCVTVVSQGFAATVPLEPMPNTLAF